MHSIISKAVCAALLLATGAAHADESSADGFHLALGAGAGFGYDGVVGMRLQGRYNQFALSIGLGRDALPSNDVLFYGHGTAHGGAFHSLAGSVPLPDVAPASVSTTRT